MSSGSESSSFVPCVTQSTNSLKLKISFSTNRGSNPTYGNAELEGKESEIDVADLPQVTGENLFLVLKEIHSLLVRRDPRGIFAKPVTDDIAAGYSQVISHPMDLGTIFDRLCSRTYYTSATDYLADVTLMCDNAMVYNLPDTVYHQRALKLLIFCRKQLMASSLSKLCSQLGLTDGLTESEMGDSCLSGELPQRHGKLNSICCRRLNGQDSSLRSSSRAAPNAESSSKQWHLVTSSPYQSSKITMARSTALKDVQGEVKEVTDPQSHDVSQLSASGPHEQVSVHTELVSPSLSVSTESELILPSILQSSAVLGSSANSQDSPVPPRRPRGRPRKYPKVTPDKATLTVTESAAAASTMLSPSPISLRTARKSDSAPTDSECIDSSLNQSVTVSCDADVAPGAHAVVCVPVSVAVQPSSSPVPDLLNPPSPLPVIQSNDSPPPVTLAVDEPLKKRSTKRSRNLTSTPLTLSLKRKRFSSVDPSGVSKFSVNKPRKSRKTDELSSFKSANRKRLKPDHREEKTMSVQSPNERVAVKVPRRRVPKRIIKHEPEDEISVQARQSAAIAANRLRTKYNLDQSDLKNVTNCVGPRIVFLNCDTPGSITATSCIQAQSKSCRAVSTDEPPVLPPPTVIAVNYPAVFVHCLTGARPDDVSPKNVKTKLPEDGRGKFSIKPLLEPLSPEEQETFTLLDKLKYVPDEPLAASLHGPLSIFSSADMVRLSDVYGSDLTTIEYAYSLLKFVEPMGKWARRWAAERLDAATDGMHSQLSRFSQATVPVPDSSETSADRSSDPSYPPDQTWMESVGLTVDSPTPSSPEPTVFDFTSTDEPFLRMFDDLPHENIYVDLTGPDCNTSDVISSSVLVSVLKSDSAACADQNPQQTETASVHGLMRSSVAVVSSTSPSNENQFTLKSESHLLSSPSNTNKCQPTISNVPCHDGICPKEGSSNPISVGMSADPYHTGTISKVECPLSVSTSDTCRSIAELFQASPIIPSTTPVLKSVLIAPSSSPAFTDRNFSSPSVSDVHRHSLNRVCSSEQLDQTSPHRDIKTERHANPFCVSQLSEPTVDGAQSSDLNRLIDNHDCELIDSGRQTIDDPACLPSTYGTSEKAGNASLVEISKSTTPDIPNNSPISSPKGSDVSSHSDDSLLVNRSGVRLIELFTEDNRISDPVNCLNAVPDVDL